MWFVCSLCGAQHRPVYSLRYSKWPFWTPSQTTSGGDKYRISLQDTITTARKRTDEGWSFVCVTHSVP
jgi:hypothetical protein